LEQILKWTSQLSGKTFGSSGKKWGLVAYRHISSESVADEDSNLSLVTPQFEDSWKSPYAEEATLLVAEAEH